MALRASPSGKERRWDVQEPFFRAPNGHSLCSTLRCSSISLGITIDRYLGDRRPCRLRSASDPKRTYLVENGHCLCAGGLVGCCAATEHICSASRAKRACLVRKSQAQARMQNQTNGKASALSDAAAIAAIEAEISRIQSLKPGEVRALWRDTFERAQAQTRDLLVRTSCWHKDSVQFGD